MICDGVYLVSNQECMDDLITNGNAGVPFAFIWDALAGRRDNSKKK